MKNKNPRFDTWSIFIFLFCLLVLFLNVNKIGLFNLNSNLKLNNNIKFKSTQKPKQLQETNVCSSLNQYNIILHGTTLVTFSDYSIFSWVANSESTFNGQKDSTNMNSFNWFTSSLLKWETSTFLLFRALIKPNMVYVGFGEWIGPTILYSSHLAKASYGLEPDYNAFKSLAMNAYANKCFGDNLKVFPYCIYSHSGSFQMKDAIGGSGASLKFHENDVGFSGGNFQSTTCYTLEQFLNMENLINEHLFIKVDTEGTEAELFISFLALLPKLKFKPIWLISKHANDKYHELEIKKNVIDFAKNFKCAKAAEPSHLTNLNQDLLVSYSVKTLPDISIDSISSTSNPDWILADHDCAEIDLWINDAKPYFNKL